MHEKTESPQEACSLVCPCQFADLSEVSQNEGDPVLVETCLRSQVFLPSIVHVVRGKPLCGRHAPDHALGLCQVGRPFPILAKPRRAISASTLIGVDTCVSSGAF